MECSYLKDKMILMDEIPKESFLYQEIRKHAMSCRECREYYNNYRKIKDISLNAFPKLHIPDEQKYVDSVFAKIHKKKSNNTIYYRILPVAAVILLTVFSVIYLNTGVFRTNSYNHKISENIADDSSAYEILLEKYLHSFYVNDLAAIEEDENENMILSELIQTNYNSFSAEELIDTLDENELITLMSY